jgi:hypothetical protein
LSAGGCGRRERLRYDASERAETAAMWVIKDRMAARIATAEDDYQSRNFGTVTREARRAYRKRKNR